MNVLYATLSLQSDLWHFVYNLSFRPERTSEHAKRACRSPLLRHGTSGSPSEWNRLAQDADKDLPITQCRETSSAKPARPLQVGRCSLPQQANVRCLPLSISESARLTAFDSYEFLVWDSNLRSREGEDQPVLALELKPGRVLYKRGTTKQGMWGGVGRERSKIQGKCEGKRDGVRMLGRGAQAFGVV